MSVKDLLIEGARQNNLRNIHLKLPHDRFIAITGVSGSGKSSLAFDTIFAEGQWRFIESISTYARLFLEKLDRPDVDAIHNIRPAVALEQKNPVRGSRSTVGTLTEIYDYLRLLYSKVSTPYCPGCGGEIRKWDTSQIVRLLKEEYPGRKALIVFETTQAPEDLKKRGYHRILLEGEVKDIPDSGEGRSPVVGRQSYDVVLDRLVIRDEPRLADSVEMAWREGNERLKVIIMDEGRLQENLLRFTSANSCDECVIELPEPSPLLFSFNHPVGACPQCKGFGNILIYDEERIVPDKYLSLSDGAIEPWEKPAARWWKRQLVTGAKKSGIDLKKPFREFTDEEKEKIFRGDPNFYGVDDFFQELESKRYKLHVRVFLSRYRKGAVCPSCNGKRLRKEALAYRISQEDIADVTDFPVSKLTEFFRDIDISPFQRDLAKEILRQIARKLSFLQSVGLDYLTLGRQGKTLSGGEYQRVNLSNQLASHLTGTLYVLDEPTVGLHARDTERVAKIMSDLSGIGNTVIVVEHDKGIIQAAEWVVELGPGGGHRGGEVVFSGPKEKFLNSDTLTARYIRGAERIDAGRETGQSRKSGDELVLYGARGNNLKDVNLRIPFRTLTAITGVSGSGKSSLIVETLYRALARGFGIQEDPALPYHSILGKETIKGLKIIDQGPIGRSPRSNPVTYLKIFDQIRKLFSEQLEAKAHGYGPGFFSFNVAGGRCETCRGEGYQKMEMYFFEDIYVKCEECDGKRYRPDALKVTYRKKDIVEVLDMTVDEAVEVFSEAASIFTRLSLMKDVGLGYLKLGQPATTLSGGEAQRLKICSELSFGSKGGFLYILDEPTVGLHFNDVKLLIDVLRKLVKAGNTVVVIEHNLDVIAASDWLVDLGPEGGDRGGSIIFEGTPDEIVKSEVSYTGKYLKSLLTV
jgi:excinuclease ABC subunit A